MGWTYQVTLKDEATQRQVLIHDGLEIGCSVPLDQVSNLETLSYQIQAYDSQADTTRTLVHGQPIVDSTSTDHYVSRSLILLDVPDDVEASHCRLVVRESISNNDIKDVTTERRRFILKMNDFVSGAAYSLRLFASRDGRWEPMSPWWELVAGNNIGRASTEYVTTHLLKALTTDADSSFTEALLNFSTRDDQSGVHREQMARFVFHVWERCSRGSGVNRDLLGRLAHEAANTQDVSDYVRVALDYLVLWAEAERHFRRRPLKGLSYNSIASSEQHIDALRDAISDVSQGLSTEYGPLMFKGMFASVHDRAEASDIFYAARASSPAFGDSLYLDQYVSSYLSTDEIRASAGEIAERRLALGADLEVLRECPPAKSAVRGEQAMLLFSCNPTFFSVYFPYWVSAIDYLRAIGVSLHFMLIGDRDQAVEVTERGLALADSVAAVHGSDPETLSKSLSFSRAGLPSYVEEPRTFYACARYLVARTIAARFDQRLVILDMDMVVRANPHKFIQRLCNAAAERFPVVVGGGLPSLIPARRYIANTFPVPNGEVGVQAMQDIENYIYAGLSRKNSWTLDQNALAFAAERVVAEHGGGALLDIGATFERPFMQVPISQLFEGEQRRFEHS